MPEITVMKAITVWQPWASLWACGAKQFETRPWATKYRGPIAIHAAAMNPFKVIQNLNDDTIAAMKASLRTLGLLPRNGDFRYLPCGAVIATAELVGCHKMVLHGGRGLSSASTGWLETDHVSTGKERNGTTFLRIPYLDINGEESTFRKRFGNKDFRWKYGSSGKICLYGEWRLPEIRKVGYAVMKWIQEAYPSAFVWKAAAGPYSRQGIPDVCAIIDGRFYGFEIKRPFIGELSKIQEETIKAIRAAGGVAAVVSFPEQANKVIDNGNP